MRILLWAEFQKLRRSNIILFTIFAAILIAVIVFICGLTTFSDDQLTANTVGWYMTITQVLATIFVLPSVIALLGSYMICREEQDDTIKSLRLIPINEARLTVAKMMVTFIFSVLVYLLLFMITFSAEAVLHFSDLSFGMILENVSFRWYRRVSGCCAYYCAGAVFKKELLALISISRNILICRNVHEHVQYAENILSYYSNIWCFRLL